MTRNPNLPIVAVSDPIKVALLTDDPLLRAGLSSLLAQLGSIDVVERDRAEVALWDAGVDAGKTLSRRGARGGGGGGCLCGALVPTPARRCRGSASFAACPCPPSPSSAIRRTW